MIEYRVIRNLNIGGKHGKPIIADVFIPGGVGPFPAVIFSHGFKGFKDWGPFNLIASQFAEQGFVFIKINFAFNGTLPDNLLEFADLEAFGNNNFTKELDDLDDTLEWLHTHAAEIKVNTKEISLIGHSRGGGISILKAYEDPRVHKVVAWASVAGFDRHISRDEIIKWKETGVHFVENTRTNQLMPLYLQLYVDFIRNHRRLNIHKAISAITKPVLLVHAEDDDTIPYLQIKELSQLNPLKTRLVYIETGGHTFQAAHPFEGTVLPDVFQWVVNETFKFLKKTD